MKKIIMTPRIQRDDEFYFHLGQPPLHPTTVVKQTVDKLERSLMDKLSDVEKEEERENRRKYEEQHPDEAGW